MSGREPRGSERLHPTSQKVFIRFFYRRSVIIATPFRVCQGRKKKIVPRNETFSRSRVYFLRVRPSSVNTMGNTRAVFSPEMAEQLYFIVSYRRKKLDCLVGEITQHLRVASWGSLLTCLIGVRRLRPCIQYTVLNYGTPPVCICFLSLSCSFIRINLRHLKMIGIFKCLCLGY